MQRLMCPAKEGKLVRPHNLSYMLNPTALLDEAAFDALAADTQGCTLCPGMQGRLAVFSRLNGSLTPKALLVAEAPGRQGADRTRIPFCGDASGEAFSQLLAAAELTREDLFITNAALCSPRSHTGANRAPTAQELVNCSHFLRRTIQVLNPPIVVAIGSKALSALQRIERHGLKLSESALTPTPWLSRTLVAAYHPSPQVLISSRSLDQQREDWRRLGAYIRLGVMP